MAWTFKLHKIKGHYMTRIMGKVKCKHKIRTTLYILTGKRNATSKIYDKLLRREKIVTAVKTYTCILANIPGKQNWEIKITPMFDSRFWSW